MCYTLPIKISEAKSTSSLSIHRQKRVAQAYWHKDAETFTPVYVEENMYRQTGTFTYDSALDFDICLVLRTVNILYMKKISYYYNSQEQKPSKRSYGGETVHRQNNYSNCGSGLKSCVNVSSFFT
jgi:hypothetical protein